ncbi:MAG: AGE family epimerase/isomerase, partial [Fibrobacteres bacterium]|nr:AGE family epimerase/isomerase [Fibrobacterota bacterium]
MNYSSIILRYEKELFESVTPFWEKNCIDKINGGFFSFLARDGAVFETDKYMWVQWRIVYMFACLYLSEYSKQQWLKFALKGYEFLRKNGRDKFGNYYFAL